MMKVKKLENQNGSAAIAALLLMPIIFSIGAMAVDFSYQLHKQDRLGQAAESISLTLSKRNINSVNDNQLLTEKMLDWYFPGGTISHEIKAITGGFNVKLGTNVKFLLSQNIHTSDVDTPVSNQGAASFSPQQPQFELALVLDLSGSMAGQKLSDLKSAARNFINSMSDSSYISLIPYSNGVSFENQSWSAASNGQKTCIYARARVCKPNIWGGGCTDQWGSESHVVANLFASAASNNFLEEAWRGGQWLAENCSTFTALPLTSDKQALLAKVNSLSDPVASTTTISYEGIIWGGRMIAPQWRGQWGNADLPKNSSEIDKHLILFTDGGDTGVYRYIFRDLVSSGLCDALRNNGYKLHYVGYQLRNDFKTNNIYHFNCFGDENMVNAQNVNELIDAFVNAISNDSSGNRLKLVKPE